jgi:hypothetical protein
LLKIFVGETSRSVDLHYLRGRPQLSKKQASERACARWEYDRKDGALAAVRNDYAEMCVDFGVNFEHELANVTAAYEKIRAARRKP